MVLTKTKVKGASYDGDGSSWHILYDTDDDDGQGIPGFGLRVYPGGTKSYVVRYRTQGGRHRFYTIGRHPTLTVKQARDRAKEVLAQVWLGEDPQEERKRSRKGVTVADFCDTYLERHSRPHKKSSDEDERRIETRIKPALGSMNLADVTRADVADLHAEIGKDGKVEANRVVELLRAIYNKARKWGAVPTGSANPASDYDSFHERSRDRWVRPRELPHLAEAIAQEDNPYIRAAVWLLLLTGLRKTELLETKWEDVDLEDRELRVPETKSGRAHAVPLSGAAVEVLRALPRENGNPHVFVGHKKGDHLHDFKKAWRRIRKQSNLEDLTIHDLRRTVGSWMANAGESLQVIGDVLNHSDPSATEVYARLQEDSARRALEAHGERLADVAGLDPVNGGTDDR